MKEKLKILFLCTGNSCRSQMAEGLTRHYKSESIDVYSAGIMPKGIDPLAEKVMKEIDIDISNQKSENIKDFYSVALDFVITVCGHANENCPVFPGITRVVHFGFEDPPKLAENASTEEEALEHYRRVRDEIKEFVLKLPDVLFGDDPYKINLN